MTTGGAIGLEEVKEILEWPDTVSVGQVPHQDVLALNEEFTEKIAAYRSAGRRVCGQSFTGLPREDIDAYVAGGVTGDLGCKTYDDILTRLRAGLYLQLVEAPAGARRNLGRMLEGVVRQGLSTRNCGFCVDDANVHDIVSEGFGWLAAHVKIALEAGVSPVEVFQMASFNTASHYGKDHLVGSITPGRLADILLLRDLDQFPPAVVIVDGQVVARDGIPLWDRELRSYPEWALETVDFHSSISAERFSIPAPDGASGARVRGIDLPSPDATGYNRNLVTELQKGAIGTSLAAGDGNVVVLGCDPLSVMACLKTIENLNGGFVVAQDDNVLASVPLPLLGQMSIEPYEEMLEQFEEALNAARSLGCTLTNPFSTIGLTVLPTVAEVGMSDYGLIDAVTGEVVDTVVAWL
jgi:adenine deaminase